jgi:hypothetical protein
LVHNAQAVEGHGLDGVAHGNHPGFWMLPGGLVHAVDQTEFIDHAGPQAPMIQDLTAR